MRPQQARLVIAAATEQELGNAGLDLEPAAERWLIGIGVVEAAAALSSRLARMPVDGVQVIFIGTAGAFPDSGLEIGSAVSVTEARLEDGYEGDAYLPAPAVGHSRAGIILQGLPAVVACTRVGISKFAPPAAAEPLVENMEVYGVLRACERLGVAAGAVLAISNIVGPMASQQWRASGEAALATLRARLPDLVAATCLRTETTERPAGRAERPSSPRSHPSR